MLRRLTDAVLMQRRVEMTYYSAPSGRTKSYSFDPMRLTAADGGMYITGWVQEYEQMRTFAAERIRKLAVTDQIFEMRTLPPEPFGNSIGAFSGRPELIDIEFDRNVADFVASREWHARQEVNVCDDGSMLLRMCVSNDRPLRTRILGFGRRARVLAPSCLAREI